MGGSLAEQGGWPALLGTLTSGGDLTASQAGAALSDILTGDVPDAVVAAFIVGLRMKGETVPEVSGMVDAALAAASPLDLGALTGRAVDVVGTGGASVLRDRAFNVSTVACFVAAGAGVVVCKHGNRKASSTSGSFDLLEQLGVATDLDGPGVAACVREAGIGFCFARSFHPAFRFVAPVRSQLGVPTVFNLLGPLSHPGRVTRQVLGVTDPGRLRVVSEVLAARGIERALVVHGGDGLDELTTTTTSTVLDVRAGTVTESVVDPMDLGFARATPADLGVGSPQENAVVARSVLAGEPSPHRDLVVLNAAAALVVSGLAADLHDGVVLAASSIDDGAASATLDRLVHASQQATTTPPT